MEEGWKKVVFLNSFSARKLKKTNSTPKTTHDNTGIGVHTIQYGYRPVFTSIVSNAI